MITFLLTDFSELFLSRQEYVLATHENISLKWNYEMSRQLYDWLQKAVSLTNLATFVKSSHKRISIFIKSHVFPSVKKGDVYTLKLFLHQSGEIAKAVCRFLTGVDG